jgi:hypothetical protein
VTEDDRTARVEKWRLDQSRAVLEEIERETRRMRQRAARMNSATGTESILRASTSSMPRDVEGSSPPQGESFWRRITRRVIRDLIGLDESALSVIFGETYVQGDESSTLAEQRTIDRDATDATPTQRSPLANALESSRVSRKQESWELKLLETIARELGTLVHQLSDHNNEGAFSTYKRIQTMPLEYAGMKVPRQPSLRSMRRQNNASKDETSADALFVPTVPQAVLTPDTEHGDTSLWGIEEEPENGEEPGTEREYWEQEVDIKMIFNYLKRRFSIGSPASPPPASTASTMRLSSSNGPVLPPSWAAASAAGFGSSSLSVADSVRRAEIIRRHHPLVSRAAAKQQQQQSSVLRRHHAMQRRAVIGGGLMPGGGGSSSCASQSTKKSRTGSSRHYWGSASTRSAGAAGGTGALGNWGEV